MDPFQVERVRSFNRAVTRRVGALEESYLSRGRPLGEARLIFEIGTREGADIRALRERLGLDSGYMSRLLRSLEKQGIVTVRRKPGDGRVREIALTESGRAERAAYDALSDRLAQGMLAPLSDGQRQRLVEAMALVEKLLGAAAVTVEIEAPDAGESRQCLEAYYAELDQLFEDGFDPGRGKPIGASDMMPPAGWFMVARLEGMPVGCGALTRLDARTGEIKRVWTHPGVRGMRVASRVMDALEAVAREAGFAAVRLDTNRALNEAQALYRARGYVEIARYNDNPYAHHWFEKRL